jgi:putative holliday junction resolvase
VSDPKDRPQFGRVAGVDYGAVRVGIAISDPRRIIASPLEIYTRRTPQLDERHFQKLVEQEAITLWVVGLPIHADGRESRSSAEARQFGYWLEQVTGVPVEYFDERFTTREAVRHLAASELSRKKRKERLDKVAAQIILASYLESTRRDEPPGPLA